MKMGQNRGVGSRDKKITEISKSLKRGSLLHIYLNHK